MSILNSIQMLAVIALPVLFAITVHEAAHGWMASRLGDGTAKMLGRVSLNPLKHVDPIGTLIVPVATFLLTGFLFGWAKPVPIDGRNLRNPRRDMALVALAGPGANLLMAVLWGLVVQVGLALWDTSQWVATPLVYMGAAGVFINVILMALNLFPLLPLDGGRVLNALLPPAWSANFSRLEPYGLLILLAFLVTGLLGAMLTPVVAGMIELLPGANVVKELVFGP
jgi:Zn-dependent protease